MKNCYNQLIRSDKLCRLFLNETKCQIGTENIFPLTDWWVLEVKIIVYCLAAVEAKAEPASKNSRAQSGHPTGKMVSSLHLHYSSLTRTPSHSTRPFKSSGESRFESFTDCKTPEDTRGGLNSRMSVWVGFIPL